MTYPSREDLTKEAQLARSPGGNRRCSTSGELKASCSCRPCIGRRSKGKGRRKQNDGRKALEAGFGWTLRGSNEEDWRAPFRIETKAGAIARTVDTFYRNTKAQSDARTAIGDGRPFMAEAMPDGMSGGYIVLRTEDISALRDALRGTP